MKKSISKYLVFLFLLLSFGAHSFAAEFGGVGGIPANPDENIPHSKEWFIYTLKPGEKKDDAILIRNNDDKPADVIIYATDSDRSTDGGFALKQFVDPKVEVGKWITLSKSEVHLDAYETVEVPFKIEVPNDPRLDVGEHTGGILIQKKGQQLETAQGLVLLTRVGVRVYVTIPGEIIKKLDVTDFQSVLDKKKKLYNTKLTIQNSGNVSQDITLKVRVKNLYPWMGAILKDYPIENERIMQVQRDDALVSNFEFKKPFWGKLQLEAEVLHENGTKTLTATPLIINVPLDQNILILLIIAAVFIASSILLWVIVRKKRKAEKKSHVVKKKSTKKKL